MASKENLILEDMGSFSIKLGYVSIGIMLTQFSLCRLKSAGANDTVLDLGGTLLLVAIGLMAVSIAGRVAVFVGQAIAHKARRRKN